MVPTLPKHLREQEIRMRLGAKKAWVTRRKRQREALGLPPLEPAFPPPNRPFTPEEVRARRNDKAYRGTPRGEPLITAFTKQFPRVGSGVYFLLLKGEVVYVGCSSEISERVTSHSKSKVYDDVRYLPLSRSAMFAVEAAFIRLLRPRYNRMHVETTDHTPDDMAILQPYLPVI